MKLKGVLKEIEKTCQVTPNFKRRKFILEYWSSAERQEYVTFELIQQRCDLLESFNVGDPVIVTFSIKGNRKEDDKGRMTYFNNLQAWLLERDAFGIGNQNNILN